MSAGEQPAGTRRRSLRVAASVVAFQAAWFACILSAARGEPWFGVAAVTAAVALMLALGDDRRADAVLVGMAVATGIVVDSALAQSGLVRYASPGLGLAAAVAPVWILGLWALWGAVLREPLRWLHGRPIAAAVLGGVGGPLSYAAGARMGACSFPEPVAAMWALGVCWALVTPLQLAVAARLEHGRRVGVGA